MDELQRVVFHPLDRDADIDVSYRNLPHWFQVGAAVFITFRTADSLPREALLRMIRELEDWLTVKSLPRVLACSLLDAKLSNHHLLMESLDVTDRRDLLKRADRLFHGALDECWGACLMRRSELASIVAEAILHHNGSKYDLDCFVIMPNHVHAIAQFREDGGRKIVGQSWMRFSARQIHQRIGASGAFWQPEEFDHVIRSPEQFVYLQKYIADNPKKANLHSHEYQLWERV